MIAAKTSSLAAGLVLSLCALQARADADACASNAEHAQDLRDAGKLHESLALFEMCATESCPKVVREDCSKALLELKANAPRILVHIVDTEGSIVDAVVAIDGRVVPASERSTGTLVDPGTHHVTASKPPLVDAETTVVVARTDGLRWVDLRLQSRVESATVIHSSHTAPLVFGGVGIAFLAAFGVLGTWTYVDYNSLTSSCSPGCSDAQVSPLRTRALVADIMLGVGVTSLAIATILWITRPATKIVKATLLLTSPIVF